jgi:hypothetical protein
MIMAQRAANKMRRKCCQAAGVLPGYSGGLKSNTNDWHSVARRIQAIGQTGLAYATSAYDVERYGELSAIAAPMIAGPHPPIPVHAYKLLFRCELLGGVATASPETAEVGFFAEDQIPALSFTRTLPEQVGFVFQCLGDPETPTAFD